MIFNKSKRIAGLELQITLMHQLNEKVLQRLSILEEENKHITERLLQFEKKQQETPPPNKREVTPQQVINEYFYFKEEHMSNGASE
jgi:hypothetical protein